MITLFACPKPFRDPHICIIQRNAIRSWTLLKGNPEVILVGDELGVREICAELKLRHVSNVACNDQGTPRLDDVFQRVQSMARHDALCYVNADIVLMDGFVDAAREITALKRALMIGARTDVNLKAPIDFTVSNWASGVETVARANGKPMSISSDYYLFRRGLFDSLPPFLVGRPSYDNWMIWHARNSGYTVVDASEAVLAIHQDHSNTTSWVNALDKSENDANRRIAGRWRGSYTLRDADAVLSPRGLRGRRLAAIRYRVRAGAVLLKSEARVGASRCWNALRARLIKSSEGLA